MVKLKLYAPYRSFFVIVYRSLPPWYSSTSCDYNVITLRIDRDAIYCESGSENELVARGERGLAGAMVDYRRSPENLSRHYVTLICGYFCPRRIQRSLDTFFFFSFCSDGGDFAPAFLEQLLGYLFPHYHDDPRQQDVNTHTHTHTNRAWGACLSRSLFVDDKKYKISGQQDLFLRERFSIN